MKTKECELPSYYAAQQFIRGEAVLPLITSYFGRSLLIGTAFMLVDRDWRQAARNGLIASAAVEAYVLYKTSQMLKVCPPPRQNGVPLDYTDHMYS